MSKGKEHTLNPRSEEVQEILGQPPRWLLRWGISIIALVMAMMLAMSWLIHYPDTVTAPITVTTLTPPADLVAHSTGELRLHVEDRQTVQAGDLLAEVGSAANPAQVRALRLILDALDSCLVDPACSLPARTDSLRQLGTLQAGFALFSQDLRRYQDQWEAQQVNRRLDELRGQVSMKEAQADYLGTQRDLLLREVELAKANYDAEMALVAQGASLPAESRVVETAYLNKKYAYEEMNIAMVRNMAEVMSLRSAMDDITRSFQSAHRDQYMALQQSAGALRGQVAQWEQEHLLTAPYAGMVSLGDYWGTSQHVQTGAVVLHLMPLSDKYRCTLRIPSAAVAKVRVGQEVRLRMEGYPPAQHGVVKGRVSSIGAMATDGRVLVQVQLTDGLVTHTGHTIEFRQQMQGTADIITDDLRLLQRLFRGMTGVFQPPA